MSLDTAHYNCVKRNIQYRQEVLEDLKKGNVVKNGW